MPLLETKGAASAQGFGLTLGGAAPVYIEDVFSTWLYTGTGATQTITNGIDLAGKGGLVWNKWRSAALGSGDNELWDTARGANQKLISNTVDANINQPGGVSFNSTGFTMGANGNNSNGALFASWTFREQPKFFDVVTYTGNGTAGRTVAHSLGSVPGCIIIKRTDLAEEWVVYHRSLGTGKYMRLASTAAEFAVSMVSATSTTNFTLTSNPYVNDSGGTYVVYLFAHDAGGFGLTGTDNVISCGSVAAGTTNQTITLGYEPQFVLFKKSSAAGNWFMADTMRGIVTESNGLGIERTLQANTSAAEDSTGTGFFSINATGMRWETQDSSTYIYIAIRRGPMKTPTTGTSVYNAVAYTGDGSTTREISTSITPDLAMTQGRSSPYVPFWCSRLSGAPLLYSSSTDAERLASGFTSGGFRINTNSQAGIIMAAGSGGTANNSNANNADFINWNFRRAPGFFDVVCFSGQNTEITLNHSLGVAPELIIVKTRSPAGYDWYVQSSALASATASFLVLNKTDAIGTSADFWGSVAPTATQFRIGGGNNANSSGRTYVAHLFASCPGVSKVGSYTGTGNTLQINCGFTGGARFVLIKRTDSTSDWYVWDSARGIVAGNDPYLLLNIAASEQSGTDWVDTHSPGFELSNAVGNLVNTNGGTYIFLAIA